MYIYRLVRRTAKHIRSGSLRSICCPCAGTSLMPGCMPSLQCSFRCAVCPICHPNATCVAPGVCVCNSGYVGGGIICRPGMLAELEASSQEISSTIASRRHYVLMHWSIDSVLILCSVRQHILWTERLLPKQYVRLQSRIAGRRIYMHFSCVGVLTRSYTLHVLSGHKKFSLPDGIKQFFIG
jgi:hypothetical protein